LMRLCDAPPGQPVRVSAELFDVLTKANRFSELSQGAFDVTVGPLVRQWRFARKKKVLPLPPEVRFASAAVGYRKVLLNSKTRTVTLQAPNMRLDLGGIAKGYAADEALAILRAKGLTRALVAASGDIAAGQAPPGKRGWKVSISSLDPSTNQSTAAVLLRNAAISTSGDIEQFIEIGGTRYSHIVDPKTGHGLTNRIQVTVIARKATDTDALATAVSVLGPERGLQLVEAFPSCSALILLKDEAKTRVIASKRFRDLTVQQ